MALPEGESFVGRDLRCHMRFNDPVMSRRHLSLVVQDGQVTVKDLNSSNGTRLNGEPLFTAARASHGDIISIGAREFKILESERGDELLDNITLKSYHMTASEAESSTLEIRRQRCPECSSEVSVYDDACKKCGYTWADFRPQSSTKVLDLETYPELKTVEERRQDPRHGLQVPVIYTSESLAIESHALDLSRGGVFIRTQILEPVGTLCSITMLVDGSPALTFDGQVSRVVEDDGGKENPLGLGIKFLNVSDDAQAWLDALTAAGPVTDS